MSRFEDLFRNSSMHEILHSGQMSCLKADSNLCELGQTQTVDILERFQGHTLDPWVILVTDYCSKYVVPFVGPFCL